MFASKGVILTSRSKHVYTKSASVGDKHCPLSGTYIGYLQVESISFMYKGFWDSVGNKLASTLLPLRCLKPHRQRKATCNPYQDHPGHLHLRQFDGFGC